MGYTALLFCPEEKTARTVTQVLSELEFTVEACIEPFAAVKKLMGQHFDAVVVDCDNEQNATLLFKSARNSASNQTSLAVAVVEGQAGVAKAFRIGANLVLTKPINIEHAKGTLRVARGLLRKSEPGKTAGATSATAAPAATPSSALKAAPSKAAEGSKFEEPKGGESAAPVFAAKTDEVPFVKPTPSWSDAAVASALAEASASAQDDDLLGIDEKREPEAKPKAAPGVPPAGSPILPAEIFAARGEAKPALLGLPQSSPSDSASGGASSGAASAPARAREVKETAVPKKPVGSAGDDDVLDTSSNTAIIGSAPSFGYGATSDANESSGASKKIFIGIAAAAIVGAGLYFGWTRLHNSAADAPASSEPAVSISAPAAAPQPTKSISTQPAAVKPSATPAASTPGTAATSSEVSHPNKATADDSSLSSPESKKSSSPNTEAEVKDSTEEPAPIMVKSGKAPAKKKNAAADADAPSAIGLAPTDAAPMPSIATTSDSAAFKPTLQTLNVSQGVSTGLLIKKVPPTYPPSALRMRIEGKVELLATISKDGDISHIKVLSGDSQLTKAASDAVSKWKYKPYLLNGEPVEIQTQVTVNFKLPTQ